MREKIKICAVNYLNTKPLILGMQEGPYKSNFELICCPPAECAQLFDQDKVDIALVPVGALIDHPEWQIVSNYGIAGDGEVFSVCLFSNQPVKELKRIFLDPDSRSSNELLEILVRNLWHIDVELEFASDNQNISSNEGILMIGDKTFECRQTYKYITDLSSAWRSFSGLPFVFARWVSHINDTDRLSTFDQTLKYSLSRIEDVIKKEQAKHSEIDVQLYLKQHIIYELDESFERGMRQFLSLSRADNLIQI